MLCEYLGVNTFVAFEMEFVFRIVFVPSVSPSVTRAVFESERHDFFHKRQKETLFRKFLHRFRIKRLPHLGRNQIKRFFFALSVFLKGFVKRDSREDVFKMIEIALIAVFFLIFDKLADSRTSLRTSSGKVGIKFAYLLFFMIFSTSYFI